MKRRPDLIVPIRDRRQHKRILTFKNFRNLLLAIAVLFAVLTIDPRHHAADNYGRLFGKQVSGQTDISQRTPDIVREAPVVDQTSADPLLIAPAAREQYLGATDLPVVNSGVMTVRPLDAPRGNGTTIVGGPEGVTIVQGQSPQRPALSGGIFRQ
jgi:hypothetical protein